MRPAAGLPLSGSNAATLRAAAMRMTAALAATAAIGVAAPAAAFGSFGGSAALTSEDVFQGLSRTCGSPAAQVDVHVGTAGNEAPSAIYAGAWGSAGLGSGACRGGRELDLYAGARLAVSVDQSLTLSYVHYAHPGGSYLYEPLEGRRFDYDEIGGTWAFEDRVFLSVGWTPNAIEYRRYDVVRGRGALSLGAQVHQPVAGGFTLSAGAGYDEVDDPSGAGFAFWSAGVGHDLGPVRLDVSYIRTSARAERLFGPRIAGGRVAAAAVWRF